MRTIVLPARATAGILLLTALVGCGKPEPPPTREARAPMAVETATAALTEIAGGDQLTGTIEPRTRVSPGTKILGRVEEVHVEEGDRVRAGQVLAILESRDLRAAVEQAQAAVVMAEARAENAEAQHRRMATLHERGSVTDKNLEDATAGERVARAAVLQARANEAAAEVTLSYAEIRSPLDGVVTAKRVEIGDMARPGEPLLEIEDLSRVKVKLVVPESKVVGISVGDEARVRVDVISSTWDATVARINPAGDPKSRTFRIELDLDNPTGNLKSGMFARATLAGGGRNALLVPETSMVRRGALEGIFIVDETGTGRLRWIRTSGRSGDSLEVISGLEPGERFVLSPPPGFTDGTPVNEG